MAASSRSRLSRRYLSQSAHSLTTSSTEKLTRQTTYTGHNYRGRAYVGDDHIGGDDGADGTSMIDVTSSRSSLQSSSAHSCAIGTLRHN